MSIRVRLRRLEGRNPQCPECGWPPLPGEKVEYVVTWYDGHDDPDSPPPKEPEYCPLCGELDVVVVTWGDHHKGHMGPWDYPLLTTQGEQLGSLVMSE